MGFWDTDISRDIPLLSMTPTAEHTNSEKPPGRVLSPKRQILAARVDLAEGPSLVFLVAEAEPYGLINGEINMEASDRYSALCPKCKTKLLTRQTIRDREGDVRYWTVECLQCGLTGKVWND
jgi:hypothetical protein